jgi:hypothetical protein
MSAQHLERARHLVSLEVADETTATRPAFILFGYFVGFIEHSSCPLSTSALGFV